MKYYKGEYVIGVYSTKEVDSLIALMDNSSQFSEFMGITKHNANVILRNFFKGKHKLFRYKGQMVEIAFIKLEQEDLYNDSKENKE